jgi:hypothetical protein
MGGPRSYCNVLLFGLPLLLLQAVKGWSPLSPPSLPPFREQTSWRLDPGRKMFGSKAMRSSFHTPSTLLYGVLSRSAILKHSSSRNSSKKNVQKASSRSRSLAKHDKQPVTRTFLVDALEEAIYRQTMALEFLEQERRKLIKVLGAKESEQEQNTSRAPKDAGDKHILSHRESEGNGDPATSAAEKKKRDPKTGIDRVDARRIELRNRMAKLEELRHDLVMGGISYKKDNRNKRENLSISTETAEFRFRAITGSKGKPCPILDRPRDTWKIAAERSRSEFGRPRGFTGLVFYSPLGVPILVGKPRAESDGVLRRASQGSDLWFQVENYEGSRILLRSSLVRGTKNSKKCFQMAADLAAFYSMWGGTSRAGGRHSHLETVPVMYTDSKHVAKRGTRAGRIRKRKSLGRVMGRPSSVEAIARGLEPS